MRKLTKFAVVGLTMFSICMSAGAEESGTSFYGFSQEIENDDPIAQEQAKMQRQALSNKIIDKMYQNNVLNKTKYATIEKDRATLFVIEKMLRDPSTSPEERVKLEAQWRKIKRNEGAHLKDYKRYTMEQNKILQEKAAAENRKIEERVKQLREAAKKKAMEQHGQLIGPATDSDVESTYGMRKNAAAAIVPKTGSLNDSYKQQVNELTANVTAGLVNEEEEEEMVPDYQTFDKIFTDEAISQAKTTTKKQLPALHAETVSEAQELFAGKQGMLIPNSPLGLSPQKREELRRMVEMYLKQNNMSKIKAYERDSLNALLFNYGVQVLETGDVITLEIIDDYTNGERMVAPDVPVPSTAQQVYVGPEQLLNEMEGTR